MSLQKIIRKLTTVTITAGLSFGIISCAANETSLDSLTTQEPEKRTEEKTTQDPLLDSEKPVTEDPHNHAEETPSNYLNDYTIVDTIYGTETTVTITNDIRAITTNAIPDHETGQFPNSGNPNTISEQSATYEYPTNPTNTGLAKQVQVPGVAVNGVKFEPGTAETVSCETGDTYRVEGLQNAFNLGMDFNNAHVQPTGEYHYHGLSELLVEAHNKPARELVHVGFAADGHLMYMSMTDTFSSSYRLSANLRTGSNCVMSLGNQSQGTNIVVEGTTPDGTYTSDWKYIDGFGDLDECNGTTINGQYAYVITDDFPYISRCLKGAITENKLMGPDGKRMGPPPRNNNR